MVTAKTSSLEGALDVRFGPIADIAQRLGYDRLPSEADILRATWAMFLFEDYALDRDRRELRRGTNLLSVEPQVFDLLLFLIRNRDHVVSRDDLIASVWGGRISPAVSMPCARPLETAARASA